MHVEQLEGSQADGFEGRAAPAATALGGSKKQQRIADLVKAQLGEEFKQALLDELEQRLATTAAPAAPLDEASEPDVQALVATAADALQRLARWGAPQGRASLAIPPGGGGAPPADLPAEYRRRMAALRPGNLAAVVELKREFRQRGLEVY
ncbi:MAG: hypothetical protein KIT29_03510 [Anaerolineales bacterium]|nr:hypothetical protein [Anaerolineales bacterium]